VLANSLTFGKNLTLINKTFKESLHPWQRADWRPMRG